MPPPAVPSATSPPSLAPGSGGQAAHGPAHPGEPTVGGPSATSASASTARLALRCRRPRRPGPALLEHRRGSSRTSCHPGSLAIRDLGERRLKDIGSRSTSSSSVDRGPNPPPRLTPSTSSSSASRWRLARRLRRPHSVFRRGCRRDPHLRLRPGLRRLRRVRAQLRRDHRRAVESARRLAVGRPSPTAKAPSGLRSTTARSFASTRPLAQSVKFIPLEATPTGIAVAKGAVWIANGQGGQCVARRSGRKCAIDHDPGRRRALQPRQHRCGRGCRVVSRRVSARRRRPIPDANHTAPSPTAMLPRLERTATSGIVVDSAFTPGSTRDTLPAWPFAIHTAPLATAIPVGVASSGMNFTTLRVVGSMRTSGGRRARPRRCLRRRRSRMGGRRPAASRRADSTARR